MAKEKQAYICRIREAYKVLVSMGETVTEEEVGRNYLYSPLSPNPTNSFLNNILKNLSYEPFQS